MVCWQSRRPFHARPVWGAGKRTGLRRSVPGGLFFTILLLCWALLLGVPAGERGRSLGLPFAVPTASAGPVNYIYDDSGRLIAVVDPAGETAIYTYDAVGNLLAITRQSSASVSLIDFTPKSGPVGTQVTIYGTGFSPTATQNTVTFNGVAATVTSATATQLVVTVPAGATTGPITVTTPTGSATSSTPFTVTAGGVVGAPTITGFTPTIGTAGTAVTITGTNFEVSPANNKIRFNPALAAVNSAATTTLTTSVPTGARSGHISVTTPVGTAVSNDDFFVPPSPYTAADVAVTGRIAFGGSQTVTLNTPNTIALLIFDGTAGQVVSAWLTNSTFSGSCFTHRLSILKPDNTELTGVNTCGSANAFLDAVTLPVAGTYTLLLNPYGAYTGSATLTLYGVVDVTGTITPGGASVPVSLTTPGQNARLTFSGTAGQVVSAWLTNSTFSGSCFTHRLSILKPDNTELTGVNTCGSGDAFLDAVTLPVAGTYTLLLNPYGAYTGSATLTLYGVVDVTGTLTINGPSVSVTITTPGQNARLTFSGTANQQTTVRVTSNTIGTVTVKLLKPDNTVLTSTTSSSVSFNLATQTLPTTGTYTVVVDPSGTNTGSLTVSVTSP